MPNRTEQIKPMKPSHLRLKWHGLAFIIMLVLLLLGYYIYQLEVEIRTQFENRRWTSPAQVYARALTLSPNLHLNSEALIEELEGLGYSKVDAVAEPGQYQYNSDKVFLMTRAFQFGETTEPSTRVRVSFANNQVASITDLQRQRPLAKLRLEPRWIGKIYPTHNYKHILIRLADMPQILLEAVMAIEGETLTQQLVSSWRDELSTPKNTEKSTFKCQFDEAVMAFLLEQHYSPDEILEMYLNEVYLGQDGSKRIQGIGRAARFYFNRPLQALNLAELVFLVGLIRDASSYNSRRHPLRAIARRNWVLDLLTMDGIIKPADATAAKGAPLGLTTADIESEFPYPAFLELVHRQLRQNYDQEYWRKEGLQVFTTLEPALQKQAEQAMSDGLETINHQKCERRCRPMPNLQGAMVVAGSQTGEIKAFVNGKNPRYAGFNRPLQAREPIGSLGQVAVYLTAFEQSNTYDLTSILDDSPLPWEYPDGAVWSPQAYDFGPYHGEVSLYRALADGYRLSAINLLRKLGVNQAYETLIRLGIEREPQKKLYLAMLHSITLSPLEVTQLYQTIASGGVYKSLQAIRAISSPEGLIKPKQPRLVEQRFEAAPIFLLNYGLQQAVRNGSGRRMGQTLPPDLIVAGKTGTTHDLRNSWFAGFDSELLTVTWVGRDDNKEMSYQGRDGAMLVWRDFIQAIQALRPQPTAPVTPNNVEWRWVELSDQKVRLPFIVQ